MAEIIDITTHMPQKVERPMLLNIYDPTNGSEISMGYRGGEVTLASDEERRDVLLHLIHLRTELQSTLVDDDIAPFESTIAGLAKQIEETLSPVLRRNYYPYERKYTDEMDTLYEKVMTRLGLAYYKVKDAPPFSIAATIIVSTSIGLGAVPFLLRPEFGILGLGITGLGTVVGVLINDKHPLEYTPDELQMSGWVTQSKTHEVQMRVFSLTK